MGRRGRIFLVATFAVALGAGGFWYWQQGSAPLRGEGRGGGRGAGAGATVPVTVAAAAKRDLLIYLTGLGTVQASLTVAIRSQVDGKLQEVLFTEGQQVHKGDVLAKIDPRLYQAALDQAKARKAQDQALLISAQKDLIRFKTLVDKSVQTQQGLEQQQAKVDQLIASIEADDAAIETAKTQLDYTTITAPNDGRMGVRNTDPGNFLRAADSTAIATLTLTKPAAVLFTLSARALNDVRDAMARGPVEVTALSQDNVRVLGTGKLLLIDSIVDQASATMRLKAMFDNDDERLWPGDFVNARVLVETRRDVITVPPAAVQRGPTTGDDTIITQGLNEGDRVVVNGQYKLQQNSKVTVNEAPAPVPVTPATAKRDRAS